MVVITCVATVSTKQEHKKTRVKLREKSLANADSIISFHDWLIEARKNCGTPSKQISSTSFLSALAQQSWIVLKKKMERLTPTTADPSLSFTRLSPLQSLCMSACLFLPTCVNVGRKLSQTHQPSHTRTYVFGTLQPA